MFSQTLPLIKRDKNKRIIVTDYDINLSTYNTQDMFYIYVC